MFENNNVISFFFTFFPVLFYSLIVYISAPAYSVRIKIASLFFFMGVLSTILVNSVHYMFPNWGLPMHSDPIIALFITAFLKVAFLEEGSKFSMFKLTEWYRSEKYVDHPSAIMFYAMSVSCGFAVSENILYAQMYGGDVLFVRSFSSVFCHMICGLFMGYFVALGRAESDFYGFHSRIRTAAFTCAGIIAATFYHGLYDFNIFVNGNSGMNNTFLIIAAGLAIAYNMSSNLTRQIKN
jgi:protease PrsW